MNMKKWCLFLSLYFCLCLLSACGGQDLPAEVPSPQETTAPAEAAAPAAVSPDPDGETAVMTCRIVDGAENGNLLLAELDGGLYGGAGVYQLNLQNGGPRAILLYGDRPAGRSQPLTVPVYLDGELAEPSVLEDGMAVDVAFNGNVGETFPAQLGEVCSVSAWSRGRGRNPMGTTYDLCGLYLQVLDDLWQKDSGLNENITLAGLDLSRAPGELTESERAALAWRFGEMHGVEVVTGTFEELKDQGWFTAEPLGDGAPEGSAFLHWEDGCLFSITPNEGHEGELYSLPTLFFNAEKWRSSLGAYGFYDCSAVWAAGGTWSGYQILGGEMIS